MPEAETVAKRKVVTPPRTGFGTCRELVRDNKGGRESRTYLREIHLRFFLVRRRG